METGRLALDDDTFREMACARPRVAPLHEPRELLPGLDRAAVARRQRGDCQGLLADAPLHAQAERNWYILTGESLP